MNFKNHQHNRWFLKANLQSRWFLLGNHRLLGGGGRQNLAGEAFGTARGGAGEACSVSTPATRQFARSTGVRCASRRPEQTLRLLGFGGLRRHKAYDSLIKTINFAMLR